MVLQGDKLIAVRWAASRVRADVRAAQLEKAKTIGELLAKQNFDREKAMGAVGFAQQTLDAQAGKLVEALGRFHESLSTEQQRRLAALWDQHLTKHPYFFH